MGCTGLTSISIPSNLDFIGEEAFKDCTDLETVTIGDGLNLIGKNAFLNCTSLEKITYNGSKYSWNSIEKSDIGNDCPIHCSNGIIE